MISRMSFFVAAVIGTPLLQAAPPSVERVSPAAGQQGTSFQITVVGAGLQNAVEAMIYSPSLLCERLEPKSDNELVLHLKAAADCSPGMHALRIRSPEGISELHVLGISKLPVINETESNDGVEDAQPVPLNTTVVGTIEAADIDSFRVTLRKGERLSVEAEAMRSGGALLDAVLNIMSPSGEWLAAVDDTPLRRQDPVASITAPVDGEYIVQLHESSFEGDESSRYSLHIGTFPSPMFVYPAGGQSGQTVSVTFGGDARGLIRSDLMPDQKSPGTTAVFCEDNGQSSATGLPFRISPFGNVLEQEPNNEKAEVVSAPSALPIALNGVLQEPGDIDCFRIRAEAGQQFNVEVFAGRLGSPVDTLLEIQQLDGTVIAVSDDGISHDSQTTVTFPESAEYVVQVTDKRGNGGDGSFYRVEISPFSPALTTFLSRPNRLSQERQSISVPRGNRVVTFLAVQRSGFSGDVHLVASGLPAGVELPGALIPTDRFWVPMVMAASADAPLSGALIDIEASGNNGQQSVTGHVRQIVDLVGASADQLFLAAEVDRLAVAVVEEVPYSITLASPATSLAPDGTLDLQVVASRTEEFSGALEVSFPFLPPWVDGPDKIIIPAGQTTAVYTLHAWPKAVPRTWQICAETRAAANAAGSEESGDSEERGRLRRKPMARTAVASNLVDLTIQSSPVAGQIGVVVAEQGQPQQLSCSLDRSGELPESMTAVLEGLPNRVTAEIVQISADDNTINFELKPESSSPTGNFPDLMVRLTGTMNGQNVSWRIGRGGSLRIEPAGALVKDDNGMPLSRLELLRRQAVQSVQQ